MIITFLATAAGFVIIFVHVQGYSQVRTPSLCTCKVTARCVPNLCACARLKPGVYTILVHVQITARCVQCSGRWPSHTDSLGTVVILSLSHVCTPSLCTCKVTARCVPHLCARARLQPGVYTIFVHVQGYSQVCTPSLCTCKVTARCVHHLCARARLQPGVYIIFVHVQGYSQVCTTSLCTCKVTARCVPPSLCTCKVTARGVQCSGR